MEFSNFFGDDVKTMEDYVWSLEAMPSSTAAGLHTLVSNFFGRETSHLVERVDSKTRIHDHAFNGCIIMSMLFFAWLHTVPSPVSIFLFFAKLHHNVAVY